MRRKTRTIQSVLALFILAAGLAVLIGQSAAWERNILAVQVARAMLAEPGQLEPVASEVAGYSSDPCYPHWFLGIIAKKTGDGAGQESDWDEYLQCQTSQALNLVHAGAPENTRLAKRAVEQFPNRIESWLWLGDTLEKNKQHAEALTAYRQVTVIRPQHGLAWCHIGGLLRWEDAAQAQQAYLQCCQNGDPGANGCWNAGQMAEKSGDLRTAIQYYRMSAWENALNRANELEKSLQERP